MIGNILIAIIFLIFCYCIVALYRNELVAKYRYKYVEQFGSYKFREDMPPYDYMLYAHREWSIKRLRRYIAKGEL